jgi:hypothetical protein
MVNFRLQRAIHTLFPLLMTTALVLAAGCSGLSGSTGPGDYLAEKLADSRPVENIQVLMRFSPKTLTINETNSTITADLRVSIMNTGAATMSSRNVCVAFQHSHSPLGVKFDYESPRYCFSEPDISHGEMITKNQTIEIPMPHEIYTEFTRESNFFYTIEIDGFQTPGFRNPKPLFERPARTKTTPPE